jgi:hypothetical protein
MAQIIPPKSDIGEAKSVAEYLTAIARWQETHKIKEESFLSGVWFRGNGELYTAPLEPGIYRKEPTERAQCRPGKKTLEEKRLDLERHILAEFRTTGAPFFDANTYVNVYFIAQHYGMPTRLLDWTTNPLAGLFFAVEDTGNQKDGEVFLMEPKRLLELMPKKDKLYDVISMRNPYVRFAIGQSFWHKAEEEKSPWIIAVRPDNQRGRIGQQNSCFTLHMHNSEDCKNDSLAKIKIPLGAKKKLLDELHRLNINKFTIYNDLDNLSKVIKRAWYLK